MNIKILVAAHKKYRMPEDKIYFPVQVGSYGKENIGFARDDEGDNISQKNPYFCELTGLYWIWKNVDADYYGLVHYRRYFSAVPKIKRTSHDKFRYLRIMILLCLRRESILLKVFIPTTHIHIMKNTS